jgi:pimeloyl-ACP methyl ester carboxylesterase
MLHPVNTAAVVWSDVLQRVERWAVAVDYRGHGESVRNGPFDPADYAEDAIAAMDAAGVARAVLVGASVGGAVSVEIARRIPERVAGIALYGAALRFGTDPEVMDAMVEDLRRLGTDGWFAAHASEILGPGAGPDIPRQVEELAGGRPVELVEAILRGTFVEADSRPAAATVSARGAPPAMVVTGSHDPTCPQMSADELGEYLGCPTMIMDNVGHLPMLECPGETARLLTAFLDALERIRA